MLTQGSAHPNLSVQFSDLDALTPFWVHLLISTGFSSRPEPLLSPRTPILIRPIFARWQRSRPDIDRKFWVPHPSKRQGWMWVGQTGNNNQREARQ